jgi:DNA repair protein RecO (recombination protein O)
MLACLCHASFHLLALAGVAPQVHHCCVTQQALSATTERSSWWAGFSSVAGGIIAMTVNPLPDLTVRLTAMQLTLLQQLTQPNLPSLEMGDNVPQSSMVVSSSIADWLVIERALRQYAQYHFERPIRSADLMESYLSSALSPV